MSKRIYADFSYLILLAASFGGIIVLGAFVAPLVFNTDKVLVDTALDRYQQGLIMGEIFSRFSYWIYVLAGAVTLYEAVQYKMGNRDAIAMASGMIVIATSLLYSAVYVPKIMTMHALGREAAQSDTFNNLHIASEIDFKILAVALIVLFVRRLMLLRRA